jgi:protein-tyrosine phosphatase
VDVLVLCRANVARSPLAEVMLAAAGLPDVRFSSAGVRARAGHAAADESQRLAAERGLDLGGHRSVPASPELVARADLVLAMSESIRDIATPLAPRAVTKTFTFREFVRLTEGLDPTASGAAPGAERLAWLRDHGHRARPVARRADGPEDVTDPMGRPWDRWVALGDTLDGLVGRIVTLASVPPGASPA